MLPAPRLSNRRRLAILLSFVTGLGFACAPVGGAVPGGGDDAGGTETVEVTDYRPPVPDPLDAELADDRLEDKRPKFDPELVDRRPEGDWLINSSAAVLKLNVPIVRPDVDTHLLELHKSYAAAARAAGTAFKVLPSVNAIDGKAKQFDDGLYAAIDAAYYRGLEGRLESHVALVKRLYDKVGPSSPAAPFLAAGLELAGEKVEPASPGEKERLLKSFLGNQVESKPIGVYTWTPELQRCFRFLRFFQRPYISPQEPIPQALAKALREDPALAEDYRKALGFYANLTNPYVKRSMLDVLGPDNAANQVRPFCLFPPSTSRETELFNRIFPLAIPPDANLMRELIRAVKSGKVDLAPRKDGGWYDRQVYALETMLLPGRGAEGRKLLLTKSYKKRMLDAFKALMTKRRETHARQLDIAKAPTAAVQPLERLKPRLRVEPAPTYYLRTARAYDFLSSFLTASVGEEGLKLLHGLRDGKPVEPDLATELAGMRELFYGLYLLSCEDIGLAPELGGEENVDRPACENRASEWLAKGFADLDLSRDTRVSVPVAVDTRRKVTRLWMTLGVRMTRLDAEYVKTPSVKPKDGSADWKPAERHSLEGAYYVIPVDEFAEVEVPGLRTFDRNEFRALCDRYKTKDAIIKALTTGR